MSREPLLLIPGLLCSEDLWRDQVTGLADVADPFVTAEHTAHESIPEIARAILATAPDRFAMAGLSMGGYILEELWRQAPERITRVAFLDTSARADTPEQTTRRRGLLELANIGKFKGITPRLLPLLIHEEHLKDEVLVNRILGMAEATGQAGFIRQQTAIMARVDSRPLLPTIDVPTAVICGRQDQILPLDHSEEIAMGVRGAVLTVIEHCGHLPTMEKPEETNAALREWLAR